MTAPKKLFIKTYGCQMNVYDSERMAEALAGEGYETTDAPEGADMVLLNTCHIREKAAEKVYSELGRVKKLAEKKKADGGEMLVGVAGCVAQAEGAEITRRQPLVDVVVGPQAYHRLPELVAKLSRTSPLGRVLASGLRRAGMGRAAIRESMEETGRAVGHDLGRYLSALGTIATAAPLLGLFGTVIGMIEIFGAQSPEGLDPQRMAYGISIALYNTALGILVAIPALIFYRHFRARVDHYLSDMEQQAVRLTDEMTNVGLDRR